MPLMLDPSHSRVDPQVAGPIEIPVSTGELVDKITILELKAAHLQGPALAHVHQELQLLSERLEAAALSIDASSLAELRQVNSQLWQVEECLRALEQAQHFGAEFIALARSVYRLNDQRAAIKRHINTSTGSPLIEEKSYSQIP